MAGTNYPLHHTLHYTNLQSYSTHHQLWIYSGLMVRAGAIGRGIINHTIPTRWSLGAQRWER